MAQKKTWLDEYQWVMISCMKTSVKKQAEVIPFWVGVLVVLACVIITHWPVLSRQVLLLDDDAFLVNNQLVRNPGLNSVRVFFSEVISPSTVRGYYIPLTMTSLMAEYALGGRPENLLVFHIFSLFLHTTGVLLVMLMIKFLFHSDQPAYLSGLLFGIHPMTVEPLVWISERKTTLSGCLALLSIRFYFNHVDKGRPWRLLCSLLFFLTAVLAKPTIVPLPFLLVILDVYPLRRFGKKSLLEKIPFFLVAISSGVISLISHHQSAEISLASTQNFQNLILRIFYNFSFYLGKLIWPSDLTSCYPPPQPFTGSHPILIVSLLVGISITAAGFLLRKKWPGLLAGWMIYLICLVPVAGIVTYSWVVTSDKYIYPLPFFGILIIVSSAMDGILKSLRQPQASNMPFILTVTALIALPLAFSSRHQYTHWLTTEGYHRYMIGLAPDVALIRNNLALELMKKNKLQEALTEYTKIIELEPGDYKYWNNYGLALMESGRNAEAEDRFRRALKLNPDAAMIYNNLAHLFLSQNRVDEAMEHLKKALELNSRDADIHVNLGRAYGMKQDSQSAILAFRRAIELNPGLYTAYSNLGAMLVAEGKYSEAELYYRRALAIYPNFTEVLNNYGRMLRLTGHLDESETLLKKALAINPGLPQIYLNLAQTLIGRKKYSEAGELLQRGLKQFPGHPDFLKILGEIRSRTRQNTE